jgi:DNA processing protein
VDTAAHKGALWAGGRTIAVVACGLDITYPSENRRLFEEIVEKGGAVVSEFALGTTPEPWRFPTRNRIIAGMTRATILVETPRASGALITARDAAQYGRDVWVVPGPVDTGRSRGGHQLIQDGASLADDPDDILAALGLPVGEQYTPAATLPPRVPEPEKAPLIPVPEPPPAAAVAGLTPDEARLLQHVDLTPRHLDEAAGAAGLSASQATVAATLLEMKGLIRRLPGSLYARAL